MEADSCWPSAPALCVRQLLTVALGQDKQVQILISEACAAFRRSADIAGDHQLRECAFYY